MHGGRDTSAVGGGRKGESGGGAGRWTRSSWQQHGVSVPRVWVVGSPFVFPSSTQCKSVRSCSRSTQLTYVQSSTQLTASLSAAL